MNLRHLGADAAAFVDGTLSLAARERVIDHLARCDSCRRTIAEQRRIKALLGSLPTPPAPADLQARLLGLCRGAAPDAAPGALPPAAVPPAAVPPARLPAPRAGGTVTPPAATPPAATPGRPPAPVALPPVGSGTVVPFPVHDPAAAAAGAGRGPSGAASRRGPRRAAAVAASAGGVAMVVTAAVVGATATQAVAEAPVIPPVQRFAVEHAAVTGALPLTTPGLRLVRASLVGGVAPGMASAPTAASWSSTDPFAAVAGPGAASAR